MARQAAQTGHARYLGPVRKFLLCLCPALFAGAVLTFVLWHAAMESLLPGTWLLLYGCAVLSASTVTIASTMRLLCIMGALFVVLGSIAFVLPPAAEYSRSRRGLRRTAYRLRPAARGSAPCRLGRSRRSATNPQRPTRIKAAVAGRCPYRTPRDERQSGFDRLIYERVRLGYHERARDERAAHVHRAQVAVQCERRQSRRACAQARGGRLRRRARNRSKRGGPRRSIGSRLPGARHCCATSSTSRRSSRRRDARDRADLKQLTPMHVAIIMDGNGRWANEARIAAHRRPRRGRKGGAHRGRSGRAGRGRYADHLRLLGGQLGPPVDRGRRR